MATGRVERGVHPVNLNRNMAPGRPRERRDLSPEAGASVEYVGPHGRDTLIVASDGTIRRASDGQKMGQGGNTAALRIASKLGEVIAS